MPRALGHQGERLDDHLHSRFQVAGANGRILGIAGGEQDFPGPAW